MDDQEKTFKIQESDDGNLLDEWITKKYSNLGLSFEPLDMMKIFKIKFERWFKSDILWTEAIYASVLHDLAMTLNPYEQTIVIVHIIMAFIDVYKTGRGWGVGGGYLYRLE